MKDICPICEHVFMRRNSRHGSCTKKCSYIAKKLITPAGMRMPRSEAIAFYGEQYDQPFRSLGRTKYKPLVIAIANHCRIHGSDEFTYSALDEDIRKQFTHHSMLALASRRDHPIVNTGRVAMNRNGSALVNVWRFTMGVS